MSVLVMEDNMVGFILHWLQTWRTNTRRYMLQQLKFCHTGYLLFRCIRSWAGITCTDNLVGIDIAIRGLAEGNIEHQ